MYEVKKIGLLNLSGQLKVNNILFDCGKDMANKFDLHHWENSHFKNFIIIAMCELKNTVYLVTDKGDPIATFQTKKIGKMMRFEKLASLPQNSGKGVGTFCIKKIENIAKEAGCDKVCMEVYSPSQHALDFYLHRGYIVCGETRTLKYSEVKMEKRL